MAEPTFKDERTEKPTAKKRNKQRQEGNVFMSHELAMTIVIFLGAWVIKFFSPWLFDSLYTMMKRCFDQAAWMRIDQTNFTTIMTSVLVELSILLLPLIFTLSLVSAFSTLIQTGWVVSWNKANWTFAKIFSVNWKALNLIDMKKVKELGINVLKISLLGYALFLAYRKTLDQWIPLMDGPLINTWLFITNHAFSLIMEISLILFLVSFLDWWYRHHEFEENLKMTKTEVRDESKSADIDPKVKAMLRNRRFALFKKIMMESVPKADVIITNPTHFAVAVQYDSESMEAPKVVAKGVGPFAQKIKDLGREHGIPIVENKPLAQILFKSVEVGSYIPVTLYKAVAEILAYVYKLKGKKAA